MHSDVGLFQLLCYHFIKLAAGAKFARNGIGKKINNWNLQGTEFARKKVCEGGWVEYLRKGICGGVEFAINAYAYSI